jgi:putative ABC transport system permease protein
VTNAVLLRSLPYKNPDRLVFALSDMRKRNVKDFPFSNCDFLDLRNGSTAVFQDVAAVQTFRNVVPREDGSPELVRGAAVSTNFFGMMGASTVLGRGFIDADGVPSTRARPRSPLPAPRPPFPLSFSSPTTIGSAALAASLTCSARPCPPARPEAAKSSASSPPASNSSSRPTPIRSAFPISGSPYASLTTMPTAIRCSIASSPASKTDGVNIGQAQSAVDRISAETRKNFLISGTAGYAIRLEPMHAHIVEEGPPRAD